MLDKGNREVLSTLFKAFIPVKENPESAMRQQPPVQQPKTDMSRMQTLRSEARGSSPDKPTGASLRPCMWRKR